ncbi:MAG TPA: squalene--hopene cyclase [Tepidisphaeraceae bacterium]|nr:squalene--hopene cyclase [Tepidisphaeraceae bacterium]
MYAETAATVVPARGTQGAPAPTPLQLALTRAEAALLSRQHADGYWCAELQGDSILESEYILLKWILGQESDPDLPLIANYLRNIQDEDGGWSLFPGGPADVSGTVKGYFALKLMGDAPDAPHMARARDLIRSLGGAEKCNTFTRFYFACLGQVSFAACPSIPPEIVFLPKWFYFNLYNVSAWTRTMILPLGIVTTLKPVRRVPEHLGIGELYLDHDKANRLSPDPLSGLPDDWREVFLRIDQFLKAYNDAPLPGLRERAMERAQAWIVGHLDKSEGLGAIFPPMVYMLIVFRLWGWGDDHPRVVKAHKELRDFYIREGDTIRLQPCLSPVWDTSLTLHALNEAGLSPQSDAARRATAWLLTKECRQASDWKKNVKQAVEPSGWFFEFANPHYPDTDDTAIAVAALRRANPPGLAASAASDAAVTRGVNWLLAMQNDDGGWAAFDKTTDRPLLELIPFADHNAMQDPSCPDIAGRVLEGLGHCGLRHDHPAVARAIAYMKSEQDPDGSWWGRWGVNYVYGTWQCLTGLKSVNFDMSADWVQRAAEWLKSVQKPDGSFGETARSYDDPSLKGQGPSTASQTAWGTMGMLAALGPNDPAVKRGIDWLIANQNPDGTWDEHWFTGTGFPKVFYLKYHYYRLYFPLTALARYARRQAGA